LGRFSRLVLLASAVGLCGLGAVVELVAQPRPPGSVRNPSTPPPQGVSRGENFSNKRPDALFASDCMGSGCHRTPQGLAKGQGASSLTGFLREHYTNSRESAASLANYLLSNPRPVAPAPGPAAAHPDAGKPKPGEPTRPGEPPQPNHQQAQQQQPHQPPGRNQRGRQTAAQPTPEPPPPPPPPPPQVFDIFD
jgi:hypothetical protein